MKNCVDLTRIPRSRPKNIVENFKHLKSQHLSDKSKYSSYDQYPSTKDFLNLKPQNTPLIHVCK